MRKFLLVCVIGFALCCVGCKATVDVPIPGTEKHLFHAYIEEDIPRTFVNDLIQLRWTENDLITIFEGTTRNKKYIFLGETGDNAGDFDYVSMGFGTGNDIDCYYAVYPYASTTKLDESGIVTYTFPATQNYAPNTFGLGANVMVAKTADLDDMDLGFRNVGSYLRVKLYGSEQSVGSIVVTSADGTYLSGKASITPVYRGEPTCSMGVTGTNSVTLNCGGVEIGSTAQTATIFWIVLPPCTLCAGSTVTVNGFNGGSQTYELTRDITFNRNSYNTMTRELSIPASGTGMGVDNWGSGNDIVDTI